MSWLSKILNKAHLAGKLSPEYLVFRWVIVLGTVFLLTIVVLLWYAGVSTLAMLTILPVLVIIWISIALRVKNLLQQHFYSLANVVESLRMGEFSMRIATDNDESAWRDVFQELNLLAQSSQVSRLQAVESNILLDKLLAEFDVPVFVFDSHQRLNNINPMGCTLLAKDKSALIGMDATQLHISRLLDKPSGSVIEHWFPQRGGRWELRKNVILQDGKRFTLVLVNDLSRTLREEERTAWVRLIRVLGHELNNSLASLSSVSQSLQKQLRDEKTEEWHNRYAKALRLIDDRSTSLLRFTDAYTRLAKLPPPTKQDVDLHTTMDRLIALVDGTFSIVDANHTRLLADPDQLEQLLINLLKNAVEASSSTTQVDISWQVFEQGVRIQIIDSGLGLPSSDNLFVPFYTTKPTGSGIGLVLCRQIAEGHGGTLKLRNREDQQGCIAEVWLPYTKQTPSS